MGCIMTLEKHIRFAAVLLLLVCMSCRVMAQADTSKNQFGTYYFDGNDVVFEFDLRIYEKAVHGRDSVRVDFSDLDIVDVAVSGNFNDWSGEGWHMQRVNEWLYRLRKNLKDFSDAPNWQFKFVINGEQWTSPKSADLKKGGILGWNNIKNPNVPAPVPVDSGNVLFRLRGFAESQRVILAGTFNNWDEEALAMKRTGDGWELQLILPPGIYEYKFIADGQWMEDPDNPEKRVNQFNTFNSVLRVTKPVRFELEGFETAQEVILTGSFNNWDKKKVKMHRTESGWATEVPLTGGKHLYKFIVDGQWMTDPASPRVETDLKGNVNSVLFVR